MAGFYIQLLSMALVRSPEPVQEPETELLAESALSNLMWNLCTGPGSGGQGSVLTCRRNLCVFLEVALKRRSRVSLGLGGDIQVPEVMLCLWISF